MIFTIAAVSILASSLRLMAAPKTFLAVPPVITSGPLHLPGNLYGKVRGVGDGPPKANGMVRLVVNLSGQGDTIFLPRPCPLAAETWRPSWPLTP